MIEPTESELVDAWVTLSLLYEQSIAGEVIHRGFDTPTACRHAKATIEVALEQQIGESYAGVLWDALDERKAEAHA